MKIKEIRLGQTWNVAVVDFKGADFACKEFCFTNILPRAELS